MFAELFDRPEESLKPQPRVEPCLIQPTTTREPAIKEAAKRSSAVSLDAVQQTSLLDVFDAEAKSLAANRAAMERATKSSEEKILAAKALAARTCEKMHEQGRTANTQQQLDMLEHQIQANRERIITHKAEKLVQRVMDARSVSQTGRPLVPEGVKVAQPLFKSWCWVLVGMMCGFAVAFVYAVGFTQQSAPVASAAISAGYADILGNSIWAKAVFGAVFGGMLGVVPWMVDRQKKAVSHINPDGMLRPKSSPAVYSSWT